MCRQLRRLVAQRLAAPLAAMSLEPTKNTKGYEIVEELWRIFSYYSLHADPTSPETLKVANFMKFAKDCQILSNKLIPSTVELELTRLARDRRLGQTKVGGKSVVYNTSFSLEFQDFLNAIDRLATMLYDKDPETVAVKRMLLENVLLLACRRSPAALRLDDEMTAALKTITTTFNRSIQGIFDYYCNERKKSDRQVMAVVASKQTSSSGSGMLDESGCADDTANNEESGNTPKKHTPGKKKPSLISYREYFAFCTDYGLKSTALLTAIQVGEVFLNTVTMDYEHKRIEGMTLDQFMSAILQMALIAYRDCDKSVTAKNKVMGLLLFMWKKVNNYDKTGAIASQRQAIAVSHAGSLNVFGSGLFGDTLLKIWMDDGFPDYIIPKKKDKESGGDVLRNIIEIGDLSKGSGNEMGDFGLTDDNAPESTDAIAAGSKNILDLSSAKLNKIFKDRPEMAEFIYLEIQNMKLEE